MRYYLFFLCCLFGFSLQLNAQQAGNDVVFLKDGRAFTGIIIEQKPGQYLRILELPDQDTLQLDYADIDRITKEVLAIEATETASTEEEITPVSFGKKRWIQIHYYRGGGDYSLGGFGLSLSQELNEDWLVGGGVHYISQTNDRPFENQQFVALAADVKWRISSSPNNRLGSYLVFNGGYYIPFDRRFTLSSSEEIVTKRNTWYLNPSVAFRANITQGLGLMFDIGYQMTLASYFLESSGEQLPNRQLNNISLRGTLLF